MSHYAHNRWSGIGYLGRAPESRFTSDETAVTNFIIAVQQGDDVMWMNCTAFGRTAEIVRDYCDKGSRVYVAGPLRQAEWEGKDKQRKTDKQVTVREVELLDRKGDKPQVQESKPPKQESSDGFPFD